MNDIGKWFVDTFNPENAGPSVAGWYLIACAIIFVVFGLAILILALVAKKKSRKLKESAERIDELEKNVETLKHSCEQATITKESAESKMDEMAQKLEESETVSSGKDQRVHAYEKIFKEALMVANVKSEIAIDKSEVLEVMSVDDIRAYAASIGAKATTTMTKDEMIKSVRAREIALKSIENARKSNADRKKVEAKQGADSPKADAAQDEKESDN